MKEYGASTYGDRIADVYDEWAPGVASDPDETADFLAPLAEGGPALELGIGTGRVALPLLERGVEVHGIDASEAMVAQLRAKPGSDRVPVMIGNFADVDVDGRYRLIFIVFNTFFALLTQEEQVRCVANVGARLTEGGLFVMEAFVPDLTRFDRGQRTSTERIEGDAVRLEASIHDGAAQRVHSRHVVVTEDGIRIYPVEIRYAWPSELDLMARLAGLRLRERWGGWRREPFTPESTRHISVYERPRS